MSNETEEYFIALGFEYTDPYKDGVKWWILKNGDTRGFRNQFNDLPDIRDSFTQLKKWVIDKMLEEGCTPLIERLGETRRLFFIWEFELGCSNEEITNGDIPLAMIISATRYFKSRQSNGGI